MKKLALLIALAITASALYSQTIVQWKPQNGKTIYSATWDSTWITGRDYQPSWLVMDHDSGTADAWISWQGDSSHYGIKVPAKNFPICFSLANAKWFKVKADSAKIRLRWIVMDQQSMLSLRTIIVLDSVLVRFSTPQPFKNALLDSILAHLYVPGGPCFAVDSIQRKYDATPYTIGNAVQDSTPKWFRFNTGGFRGYITALQLRSDTANVTNAIFSIQFFKDTTAYSLIADNAALPMLAGNTGKRIGFPITLAMATGGTGSTAMHGGVTNINLPFSTLSSSTTYIYALVRAEAAWVPNKRGTLALTVSFERY